MKIYIASMPSIEKWRGYTTLAKARAYISYWRAWEWYGTMIIELDTDTLKVTEISLWRDQQKI